MHFSNLKLLALLFFYQSNNLIFAAAKCAPGCGDADACIGTEFCTTATFTTPSSTVLTTCVPTATCLGPNAISVLGWAVARGIARRPDADPLMKSGLGVMRTMGHVWLMRIVVMGISEYIEQ
ncbi:hypothetical protein N7509_010371 [Penicillium cosmopolitanum]|uniref:Extracellular membrane protein CFEM domain-containing protein n=1 Tax=Penicillium cosmopolitanum TaxID=1131564 RepID=A0A9X0B4J1_9EURO|nr:uncharacterized protein N7509_010371 [Penicillium cosmopolitanum]KAJ5387830.1 hypothetical protein N7509_010371 [Penicillium cosmopolitanum]